MEKKEIVIIGIGKYSQSLINKLQKIPKISIIAIDKNEKALLKLKGIKSLIVGDATDENFIKNVGIENADFYVIGIGSDFQSSLLIATILETNFDGTIIAKTMSVEHEKILNKIGVVNIIKPEEAAARGTFNKIVNPFALRGTKDGDIVEIADGVSTIKLAIPPIFYDKLIKNSKIPSGIIIPIVYKKGKLIIATGKTLLKQGDDFSIIGENNVLGKFLEQIHKDREELGRRRRELKKEFYEELSQDIK